MKLTEYDRGWLSALIDGEGSLSLTKGRMARYKGGYQYSPKVVITNTNPDIISRVTFLVGGTAYSVKQVPHQKPVQKIELRTQILRDLLPQLSLIAKEKQRLLLLKACTCISLPGGMRKFKSDNDLAELENISKQILTLNRRGV